MVALAIELLATTAEVESLVWPLKIGLWNSSFGHWTIGMSHWSGKYGHQIAGINDLATRFGGYVFVKYLPIF